jgi:hypothetical protein
MMIARINTNGINEITGRGFKKVAEPQDAKDKQSLLVFYLRWFESWISSSSE